MPFAFAIIGLMFVVIAVRNQQQNAITLLKSEFTGKNSFIQWFLALGVLGAIGYYKPFKPLANGMLFLIILVMVIANQNKNGGGGLFAKFEDAVQNATPIAAPSSAATNGSSVNSGGSSSIQQEFPYGQTSTPIDTTGGFSTFPSGQSSTNPFPNGMSSNPVNPLTSIF